MILIFQFIPGCMVGVEWLYDDDMVVLDLAVIRVMIFYGKEKPDF